VDTLFLSLIIGFTEMLTVSWVERYLIDPRFSGIFFLMEFKINMVMKNEKNIH